jgi:hypothetical protein
MTEPLQYAPRKAIRRYRPPVFIAIVVGLAVAFVCISWKPLTERIRTDFYLRQAKSYIAPPDQIVMDEDPKGSTYSLLSDPAYHLFGKCLLRSAAPWTHVTSVPPWVGVVFLHERRSADGPSRVVEVEIQKSTEFTNNGQMLFFRCNVRGRNYGRSFPCGDIWIIHDPNYQLGNPIRLFAGQPDPADSSHFTIKYESSRTSGIIDGWLDSNDSVHLADRPKPATLP